MNAMQAINLTPLQTGLGTNPVNLALLVPVVTVVLVAGTSLTATDAGTYTSPDSFKHINIQVYDTNGKEVDGVITAGAGNTGALNITGLAVGDIEVRATVVTTLGVIAVGSIKGLNAGNLTGSLTNWLTDFTTAQF